MKILEQLCYNDLILENTINKIICENIYQYDIFDRFINLCFNQYINKNNIFQEYAGTDIFNYLSKFWNNIEYFKKQKNLKICFIKDEFQLIYVLNNIQFLSFDQIGDIILRFNKKYGFIATDFKNNKNQAIIFINLQKCNNNTLILKKLIHQFIHYLQWNTGKKLHQFKEIKFDNINNKKVQSIVDYYETKNLNIKQIINNIINNKQCETYLNEIYYTLKNLCINKNINFNENLIKNFIKCFQIYSKTNDFQLYINNTKILLKGIQLEEFLNYDQSVFTIIVFYLHLKVNTFKNHIYGYYFKQFKK